MRIALVNLPWREKGLLGVRAGSRWPFTSRPEKDGRLHYIPFPFFLAYATSLLKQKSQKARLIDAIAEEMGEQQLLGEIQSYNPELIVIETSTPSFFNDIRIIEDIRNKFSDPEIALCGSHATVFAEQILNQYGLINYVLMGEYEYTLLDLVEHLEGHCGLGSVLGLAYREGAQVRINNPRPTADNLQDLPWPERGDVPLYKYNDGFADFPVPNVQMWASRGCPFKCMYCLWPQTIYREHRYRKRNPKDIVDEMEFLLKKFNFRAVYFDDDLFNLDKAHVFNICSEIKKRGIKIPWAAMARADYMDLDMLECMSSAGLYAIKYGIESADQHILNSCKKNINLDKTRKVIESTKRLNIKVHLTFCLGLPGETRQTVQETIHFIQEAKPNSLQFSFATPFPGTEYFRYLEQRGFLLSKDWSDYDGNYKCIVKTEKLSNADLESIRADFSNNFGFLTGQAD